MAYKPGTSCVWTHDGTSERVIIVSGPYQKGSGDGSHYMVQPLNRAVTMVSARESDLECAPDEVPDTAPKN